MTITLATLAKATEQQIFDQVARHLLKQKVRAVNTVDACKYRTENGLMCAAGCLISDEEYDPMFETFGSWASVVRASRATSVHEYFITQLQQMHDTKPSKDQPVDFVARLEQFANKHHLQFNLEALTNAS